MYKKVNFGDMKTNKNLLMLAIITLGVIFCLSSSNAAELAPTTGPEEMLKEEIAETTAGSEEITEETETINNNLEVHEEIYYWFGDNLNIKGIFQNDVIVIGDNIIIDGIIEGDIFAIGNNIRIKGQVNGDIRMAGKYVIIDAPVQGNINFFGQSIRIFPTSTVGGNLMIKGGSLDIEGPIIGNVWADTAELGLYDVINGDVNFIIHSSDWFKDNEEKQVRISKQAKILGNLELSNSEYSAIPDQAITNIKNEFTEKVTGTITINELPHTTDTNNTKKNVLSTYGAASFWIWSIIKFMSLLLVGLVMSFLFKNIISKTVSNMYSSPGKNILTGLAFILLGPVVCLLVMISIVGLPLAVLALGCYFILLYASLVFAGAAIGRKIMNNQGSWTNAILLGILLISIIKLLPYIGVMICFFLSAWAIGGLFIKPTAKKRTVKKKFIKKK